MSVMAANSNFTCVNLISEILFLVGNINLIFTSFSSVSCEVTSDECGAESYSVNFSAYV